LGEIPWSAKEDDGSGCSGEKPADSVFINGGLSTTVEIDLKNIYI
jgi:hypothetical protein